MRDNNEGDQRGKLGACGAKKNLFVELRGKSDALEPTRVKSLNWAW